jgi:endonuclease YncB( thermonuclease family)
MIRSAAALVLASASISCAADAETPASVEGPARVVDGDGLRIGDAVIRLFGVDAVEGDQTCDRGGAIWACGAESADALADLVSGKTVRCEVEDVDRYDRLVATCVLPDGTDINRAQVAKGWAVAYTDFSERYVDDEAAARAAGLGVWSSEFVRPADYRAEQRNQTAEPEPAAPTSDCPIKGNISQSSGDRIYHLPGQADDLSPSTPALKTRVQLLYR